MFTETIGGPRSLRAACVLAFSAVFWSSAHAAPGDLIWQDKVDGGLDVSDTANAVAVFGNMAFAAGMFQTGPGVSGLAVRAYDADSGELIWADQPAGGFDDAAHDVHASAREVVVCGILDDTRFGVLAYDRKQGELLWEDRSQVGSAAACEARGKKVFVAGFTQKATTAFDFSVRVYESRTGVLLWEDQFDGGAAVFDQATALSIAAGGLYVVGGGQQVAGDDDMVVRRYDADTGALIWHQLFAGPVGERDEATSVAAGQNRVFVAGRTSHVPGAFGNEWSIHAYHAATGELLWTDNHQSEEVHAVTVRGKRVVGAGGRRDGPAIVRTYDARSGALLWSDTLGSNFSMALSVDTDGEHAYWSGQSRTSSGNPSAFTVRAVDLRTGVMVWQDLFAPPGGGGRANEIVSHSNRVFAVGHDTVDTVSDDFLVRTYQAR